MKNRGQTTLEYFVLIGIIAAGLVAMQIYMKRSIQGKIRATADEISQGSAYSPGVTLADSRVTRTINESSNSYVLSPADENGIIREENKIDVSQYHSTQSKSSNVVIEILSFNEEPDRHVNQ